MKANSVFVLTLLLASMAMLLATPKQAPAMQQSATDSLTTNLPLIIDLGAGKCIPCKAMLPILTELKQTYAGKMDIKIIDVWEDQDAADKYGVRVIPTQIFFDATGKELYRHEGFFSRENIMDKCQELGFNLKQGTN